MAEGLAWRRSGTEHTACHRRPERSQPLRAGGLGVRADLGARAWTGTRTQPGRSTGSPAGPASEHAWAAQSTLAANPDDRYDTWFHAPQPHANTRFWNIPGLTPMAKRRPQHPHA